MKKTVRKRIKLGVERVRVLTNELAQPRGGCEAPRQPPTEGNTKASQRICTQLTQ